MAEIVGFVSSVGQLVTLAAEIVKLGYGYFRDVSRASRAQKNYLREISAFVDVLLRLDDALQDAGSLPVISNRPSYLSHNELLEWQKTLEVQRCLLERGVTSLLWPFKEREIVRAIDDLSRFRSILADYTAANIS